MNSRKRVVWTTSFAEFIDANCPEKWPQLNKLHDEIGVFSLDKHIPEIIGEDVWLVWRTKLKLTNRN